MKIGIFGAGAVGSVIASQLYKVFPNETYLLCNEKRFDKLSKGIVVNDVCYNVLVTKEEKMDYIIISIKNYDLKNSLKEIERFVDSKTVILPLLNGISANTILKDYFPNNNILHGIIKIEASRNELNEVSYKKIIGIHFGEEYNYTISNDVQRLKERFDMCEIPNIVFEDMKRAVWLKWLLNIGINQVSSLTKSTYKEMHHPLLQEMLRDLFLEIVAIAQAMDINITTDDAYKTLSDTLTFNSSNYTSMTQDVMAKRKTEIDYFAKTAIDLGKLYNIPTPTNEFIYRCLKSIEDNYSSK